VTSNEAWRKYLEAGAALGQETVARAEGIARGLFAPDESERSEAWQEVDQLARFGMQVGERLADMARAELTRQLKHRAVGSLDELLVRVKDLIGPVAPAEGDDPSGTPPVPVSENEVHQSTRTETPDRTHGKVKVDKAATSPKNKKPRTGDSKHNKKEKAKKKERAKKTEKEFTAESPVDKPDRVLRFARPVGPAPTP
jgi:hypothetical protein